MHIFRLSTKKKKPDLPDYYESFDMVCRLVDEVADAIADNKWVRDTPQVNRFLKGNRFSRRVAVRLRSVVYNRRMYDSVRRCDVKSETDKLLSRIGTLEKESQSRRRNIIHFTLAGAAAAALIALMWSWSLNVDSYNGMQPDSLSERVNLILPSGRVIAVDEIENHSNIVDENRTVISKGDNSIVVEKKADGTDDTQPLNYHTLNVPRGFQHDIVLEDGTHVWLNSGSSLKFPSIFAAGERKVFLEGEAYFEVTRDSLRTFVVQAQEQTLTVLGTKFNIYAYSDEPVIYAALLSGSVRVSAGGNAVTLMPDQCSELKRISGSFEVKTVDAFAMTAWRKGMFVFDDNTLEQVLMKISRCYDVDIIFDRVKARALIFNGNLPKYGDIGDILENIAIAGQIKFKEKGGKYMVIM